MGALGHYLEEEGIATTQISLVREHTAAIVPPRALWVPFVLGRPFGVPAHPEFQRRVLRAVLGLLEAASGPVLEDYPEDAPDGSVSEDGGEGFVCPVSFSPSAGPDPASAFAREVAELKGWHGLALKERGRTTAALSGLTPGEAARFITDFIADPDRPPWRDGLERGAALRLACTDIQAFYLEAVSAQPGATPAQQAKAWFWLQTSAGATLLRLREIGLAHPDPSVQLFAGKHLVPRAIQHALGAG